jgi:hypothetical protein
VATNRRFYSELFEAVVSLQFAPNYKREFIRDFIETFAREFSVRLCSVNQRTTEAEEVTYLQIRSKSVTVEEKTLLVQ